MVPKVLEQFTHFLSSALGVAAALLLFGVLVVLLRGLGWEGPVEPIGVLDEALKHSAGNTKPDPTVNIEYRSASGELMELGPHVQGTLRNGRGRSAELREGVFLDCNPDIIQAGGLVQVAIQAGRVKESLVVQLDFQRQMLFVQSRLSLPEVLDRINRSAPGSSVNP